MLLNSDVTPNKPFWREIYTEKSLILAFQETSKLFLNKKKYEKIFFFLHFTF